MLSLIRMMDTYLIVEISSVGRVPLHAHIKERNVYSWTIPVGPGSRQL